MPRNSSLEGEIIGFVQREKSLWQEMESDLTEKIRFRGLNIIKKARKNYFNIFDDEYDPITKKKKIFVPLTRDMVETTVKNIDIDTKDVVARAKTPAAYPIASLTRYILAAYFEKLKFGQILNRIIRKTGVEGVSVLKKINSNKKIGINLIENLNFLTDPGANYLAESSGNIETNWLTMAEINENKEWENLETVVGTTSIERIPYLLQNVQVPYNEVTERWGLMPKNFITEDPKDKDTYIEGGIIITGLTRGPQVQLVFENKSGQRPYQEFRTKMYDGRWLGLGIGEDLFTLQAYLNEIFNLRLTTARIKQLGIFEVRKGSGITPQMLTQLYSGGAIPVTRLGQDIQELKTSDVKPSSYQDENQAYLWAQRMVGAWEMARGEALPASMPATTAVIQEKGMNSGFSLQQEELGFSISQFIENLLLPAILDGLTDKEILRITGDPNELKVLDDTMVNSLTNDAILEYHKKNGFYPTQGEIETQKKVAAEKFKKFGRNRFLEIRKSLFNPEKILDSVDIFVTGESFNKAVMVSQLNDLLLNYSKVLGTRIDSDRIVAEIIDLMGLGSERFIKPETQMIPQMAMAAPGMPQQQGAPAGMPQGQTEMTAQAGTMESGGGTMAPSL